MIFAGPNGAGKTTCARTLLPRFRQIQQFVNADEIAKGLSPFAPESVAIQAGKAMLERVMTLRHERVDFAIETTLSGRSYARMIRAMRADEGYRVELLFVWLPDPNLSVARVAKRVSEGGHNIPPDVIRRRFFLGLSNLFNLYIPLVDRWLICDNSGTGPQPGAMGGVGVPTMVLRPEILHEIHQTITKSRHDEISGTESS